jgi:Ca-activated chloride channel family protein
VSFESPLLLLALLAVPGAVAVLRYAERRRMRFAVRFTNLDVLADVASPHKAWRRLVPLVFFLLTLAAASVAVARPHLTRLVADERAAVILVIDTSRSMQSEDVRPTRLAAAEAAARAFIDRLPKRLRLGLIVFAGDVQVGAPPTRDHALVQRSLESIGIVSGSGGTAIGDAIARAVDVGLRAVNGDGAIGSAGAPDADSSSSRDLVSILFLSDGRQNRGILPPLEGAARARAAGIPVYTVALGSANASGPTGFGSPGRNRAPDPETLKAIARMTGGRFFAARSADTLKSAYANLGSRLGRTPGRSEITHLFLLGAAVLGTAALAAAMRWPLRLP